jgi:hypothetical protein
MSLEFVLPVVISDLVEARNKLRDHYAKILDSRDVDAKLEFTFDGNLVGDFGEAIAADLFGISLVKAKSTEGIDGYAQNGISVQVKATGTGRGPAFRATKIRAEHLIFFELDFTNGTGKIVYNGPERYAFAKLPAVFKGQRSLGRQQIRDADSLVKDDERLPRIDGNK